MKYTKSSYRLQSYYQLNNCGNTATNITTNQLYLKNNFQDPLENFDYINTFSNVEEIMSTVFVPGHLYKFSEPKKYDQVILWTDKSEQKISFGKNGNSNDVVLMCISTSLVDGPYSCVSKNGITKFLGRKWKTKFLLTNNVYYFIWTDDCWSSPKINSCIEYIEKSMIVVNPIACMFKEVHG